MCGRSNDENTDDISFHRIPKDKNSELHGLKLAKEKILFQWTQLECVHLILARKILRRISNTNSVFHLGGVGEQQELFLVLTFTEYEESDVLTSSCIEGFIKMKKEKKTVYNIIPKKLFPTSKLKITCDADASNVDKYSSVEKDVMEFLAHYLAFKSKKNSLKTDVVASEQSWLSSFSKGGVSKPSADWFNIVAKFEIFFFFCKFTAII